jgi:hypothetical protein
MDLIWNKIGDIERRLQIIEQKDILIHQNITIKQITKSIFFTCYTDCLKNGTNISYNNDQDALILLTDNDSILPFYDTFKSINRCITITFSDTSYSCIDGLNNFPKSIKEIIFIDTDFDKINLNINDFNIFGNIIVSFINCSNINKIKNQHLKNYTIEVIKNPSNKKTTYSYQITC